MVLPFWTSSNATHIQRCLLNSKNNILYYIVFCLSVWKTLCCNSNNNNNNDKERQQHGQLQLLLLFTAIVHVRFNISTVQPYIWHLHSIVEFRLICNSFMSMDWSERVHVRTSAEFWCIYLGFHEIQREIQWGCFWIFFMCRDQPCAMSGQVNQDLVHITGVFIDNILKQVAVTFLMRQSLEIHLLGGRYVDPNPPLKVNSLCKSHVNFPKKILLPVSQIIRVR